jgi:signal transduction histidine kinase
MTYRLARSLAELNKYSSSLEQLVQTRTRELQETQAELVKQAHEAGMAEMAVGVLHNIGNAITPAKIDSILLKRNLQNSVIVKNIHLVTEETEAALQHPENLTENEKQRLISIIKLLPETISEEYGQATDTLEKICNKHDHIEGIINLQMRYARLIGDREEVDLNTMVDDALEIMFESLVNRNVCIEKYYGEIPLVRIEQTKLIQIIINLLKNAYEALEEKEKDKRKVVITTSFDQNSSSVLLSIKDNGYGFAPDEKEKMFRFGYTTKTSGSGFGLHSCANFLIANNGTLTADSPGKGKGAEFTIILPTI